MASKRTPKFDFGRAQEQLQRQFSNLDPKDPSLWPILPKILLCTLITVLVVGGAWYFWLQDYEEQLKAEESKELALREEYTKKLTKAELIRAIRFMIAAEYEATQLYMQLAESTDNKLAIKVLEDIANEELVHAGEFLRLLRELAPEEEGLYAKGDKEVRDMMKKMKKE